MNGWESFLLAEVGASATLTGLIFVGVSINLNKILALPRLPNRALEALILLLTVLVVASLLLVPGETLRTAGYEMLGVGAAVWLVIVLIDVDLWRTSEASYRAHTRLLILMNQLSLMPYIIGGIHILAAGANGLYWLVAGMLFSFVKAVVDAWVLLVEINR